MIDVGDRCRPHDKGLKKVFHKICDFLDDLEYRVPTLYKISPMIEFIYNRNIGNEGLVGIEIGTFRGINAHAILSFLNIRKLYLIDPYLQYSDYVEDWIPGHSQNDFNNDYVIAKKRLEKFKDKKEFIKMKSDEATMLRDLIPDNVDFIYVDGNHAYEYVKKDLELYYPKLRVGGVLGGDNFEVEFQGVPRAVFEFVDAKNLKLCGADKDWWIVKGETR